MAGRPKPPRLFDLGEGKDDNPSHAETVRRPYPNMTPSTAPLTETSARRSNREMGPGSYVETADAGAVKALVTVECLRQASDAATMEEAAKRSLAGAIVAARSAGCTWRAIGIATGIPYQTLHRRSARPGPGVTTEGHADVLDPTEAQQPLGGPIP